MRDTVLAAAAVFALGGAVAGARDLDAAIGRALFARAWVPAPSSTRANDGLGPLFNARACLSCHQSLARQPVRVGDDGGVASDNLVLRLSDREGRPDPVYGAQLQTGGLPAVLPEGRPSRTGDVYAAVDLAYGPVSASTRVGARLAPALKGLGALEGVPDPAILAIAEEQARGAGGVRGRPNWVTSPDGARRLGRFGSKASAATLADQTETAFALDLGMSTPGRPRAEGDCTPAQTACLAAPHGGLSGEPEIPAALIEPMARYLASLSPPVPTAQDPAGAALFDRAGCAACHRPALPSPAGPVRAFTDLLLHNLGPALDGGATEPGVAPTEWRTAPLWGLSRTLANGAGLLHDGRAATVTEAVRLHGGEAAGSRAGFDALSPAERDRLLRYVESL